MKIRDAQMFSDKIVALIKKEQQKRGISNYTLSQLSGVSEASLSYIFRGQRRPTLYTLKMIADALNIQLTEIILQVEHHYLPK